MRLQRSSQLVLVACLSLLAAPTGADQDVPFRAVVDTEINMAGVCGPGCLVLGISGTGHATHMGSLQISGPSQIDFTSFLQSGVSTLTAANGDTLIISFAGTFVPEGPDPAGPVSFEGHWAVISGTGHFEAASGTGTYTGDAAGSSGTLILTGALDRRP